MSRNTESIESRVKIENRISWISISLECKISDDMSSGEDNLMHVIAHSPQENKLACFLLLKCLERTDEEIKFCGGLQ